MNIFYGKFVIVLILLQLLFGCSEYVLQQKEPISLTLWHVYGGETDSPMNALVDKFNQTIGRDKNIIVNVTSLSNSTDIHFALVASAKKHPGAGELPDLFTTYPKTALAIGPECMVDWREYLSVEQQDEFVSSFITEGELDGRLVLLPLAKSSSALFINATIFDQFSRETGVRYKDLATWEGMFEAAARYYEWSGGKSFFKYDDWLHYSMMNTASLGGTFFTDKKINFRDDAFRSVWSRLAASAISGEICLLSGYSTTAMMTGETLCGIKSTASVLYFTNNVTFPDNTTIPLRVRVLPVPIFKGGRPLAIQRGGGLGLIKSTKERERAAVVFAEWLTSVDINVPFVINAGYFPVKKEAYKNFINMKESEFSNQKERDVFIAVQKMHADYEFYIPQFFEDYGELEKKFLDVQIELFKKYKNLGKNTVHYSDPLIHKMLEEFESAME